MCRFEHVFRGEISLPKSAVLDADAKSESSGDASAKAQSAAAASASGSSASAGASASQASAKDADSSDDEEEESDRKSAAERGRSASEAIKPENGDMLGHGTVLGMHSWISFYLEEVEGKCNYLGYR